MRPAANGLQRVSPDPVLICGGIGFIGTNVALHLLERGQRVIVYDNMSRPGVRRNLETLTRRHASLVDVEVSDILDQKALRRSVRAASSVFHFAAQTAVTTSVVDPRSDFEVNALGTVNLLEELRLLRTPVPLLFTSTNKVYGNLNNLALRNTGSRYEPQHPSILQNGVDERCPLSFHSPYGCSKGAADQYVADYARTYGLPNVTFRMSCIYGPHQCGNEDQGWVAHFLIQSLKGNPITIFGDGNQVRDVLHVSDLVNAMMMARERAHELKGSAFNIGGGPANTTSLRELIDLIRSVHHGRVDVRYEDWRIGDQRYYVSDIRSFQTAAGWSPRVGVREGVSDLYEWLSANVLETEDATVAEGTLL